MGRASRVHGLSAPFVFCGLVKDGLARYVPSCLCPDKRILINFRGRLLRQYNCFLVRAVTMPFLILMLCLCS